MFGQLPTFSVFVIIKNWTQCDIDSSPCNGDIIIVVVVVDNADAF